MNGTSPYDDAFFDREEQAVLQSARIVLPLLLGLVRPSRVIDIGCGRGAWLHILQENGVENVQGLDGSHINPAKLLITPSRFRAVDFTRPFGIPEPYDLALCLEVAEHLPDKMSRPLVATLTSAAPLILFSAAIPGQGGTSHINEQWPSYWDTRFRERNFRPLDPIRRHVRHDNRVKWYYRQNILLYASAEAIARSTILQAESKLAEQMQFEWIHIRVLHRYQERTATLQGLLRELPGAALRTFRRRLRPGS